MIVRSASRLLLVSLLLTSHGCGADDASGSGVNDPGETGASLAIVPGESIGPAKLGMTYSELEKVMATPATPSGFMRMFMVQYPDERIEVVFSSPANDELTPDSIIVAVGTLPGGEFTGPIVPGQSATEVTGALGEPPDYADGFGFYPAGISVEYDADGSAKRIGVYEPYTLALTPPEMLPAKSRRD